MVMQRVFSLHQIKYRYHFMYILALTGPSKRRRTCPSCLNCQHQYDICDCQRMIQNNHQLFSLQASGTQREQISGYFDVNNEGVSIKDGSSKTSCGPWSKKKKIGVIVGVVFVILLIIIIAIAVTAVQKHSKCKLSAIVVSMSVGVAMQEDRKSTLLIIIVLHMC